MTDDTVKTEAGRALLGVWQAGRTHPPSRQRLADFTTLIVEIEREAAAQAEARVRDVLARIVNETDCPDDEKAGCYLASGPYCGRHSFPSEDALNAARAALAATPPASEPRNVAVTGLRPAERYAIEAILGRVSADPDDDAAIAARAALRLASEPRNVLDLDGEEAVERLAMAEHDRRIRIEAECHHSRYGNGADDCRIVAAALIRALRSNGDTVKAHDEIEAALAATPPASEPHEHRPVEIDSGTSGGGYRGHPPDVICADCGEELRSDAAEREGGDG